VQDKWDKHDVCPNGAHRPFNIDAKLNGAYVAFGLLYGQRDWQQTMEVATRCGQDSDCNPASALGVLGAMRGFDAMPDRFKNDIAKLADKKFSFTDYSFNEIVESSESRALKTIADNGGTVTETEVVIPQQSPRPPKLESFNFGIPAKVWRVDNSAWKWQGDWTKTKDRQGVVAKVTNTPGSEATLEFNGTGLALVSNLSDHGGRADVYIDGQKSELVADAYIVPNTVDDDLWRVFGLTSGEHTVRIVLREDSDERSKGHRLMLCRAIVYQTER
jgi:hypothetical protein